MHFFVQSCIVESCKSCSKLQLGGKRVITIKILVVTIKIEIGDIYIPHLWGLEGINVQIGRICKEENLVLEWFLLLFACCTYYMDCQTISDGCLR